MKRNTRKISKAKIKPGEFYTLKDIVRDGLFPYGRTFGAVKNLVAYDTQTKDILKPIIMGTGRGTKYRFLGANIIKFNQNLTQNTHVGKSTK